MPANMKNSPAVEHVSECFIRPKYASEDAKKPLYLSPCDLQLVDIHYNQKGLLFIKPPSFSTDESQMKRFLEKFKNSLSIALIHFYPLAGRLVTLKQDDPPIHSIYVDCGRVPGAKLIHASLNLKISDILTPIYVPKIVHSFFDLTDAVNYDGHNLPLLAIQVTELIDGIFIGFTINHLLADGTSFWHFISSLSEICNAKIPGEDLENFGLPLSRPPIHERWFPEGHGPILSLPFSHPDEFVFRYQTPELKERVFPISSEMLQNLKAKANAECSSTKISTFQALCAHLWRCITRARNLPPDQLTKFVFPIEFRSRTRPPLSPDYFGNSLLVVGTAVPSGELKNNGPGWAAWKLHELVTNHQTDKSAREWAESWVKQPSFHRNGKSTDNIVLVGSSPRFNVYGSDFGLGKLLAVRTGSANKSDGKIMLFPARDGGNNIDMEICLLPHVMTSLESDHEFLENVSLTNSMY